MTITGLSEEPIKMNRVQRGDVLIIDGIDNVITIDGNDAFSQYDAWEFPKLYPGTNNIRITNGGTCSVSI
jgi:phage-related protein